MSIAKEIASKSATEVRNNEELMRLYIEEYEGVFGYKPNCVPCTFSRDFLKFQKELSKSDYKQQTTSNMETKKNTFKLHPRNRNKILTYFVNNKAFRVYGYNADENFVVNFLKNGTEEEIEERKKLFLALPNELISDSVGSESLKKTKAVKNEENGQILDDNSDLVSPELAKQYEEVFGKRVYYQWGAKKTQEKITAELESRNNQA